MPGGNSSKDAIPRNGRTGHLLMNYFLLLHEHPPLIVHEQDRKAYYAALEDFDREQEIEPLVSYLKQQLEKRGHRIYSIR